VAVNSELEADPGSVNSDPYAAGWLFEVKLAENSGVESLLSAEDYKNQVG